MRTFIYIYNILGEICVLLGDFIRRWHEVTQDHKVFTTTPRDTPPFDRHAPF